jgi:ABC-type nitrate/sulfonate/bicarbonate transport system substrate-binding protein
MIMNSKLMAIGIVVILIVAGVGVYAFTRSSSDKSTDDIAVLARVNTEGSGIYVKEDLVDSGLVTIDSEGNITITSANAAAWGGLVFGTPGVTSIQHIMLMTIVEQTLGLNFTLYTAGTTLNKDTVYYVPSITNASLALGGTYDLDGGIIWQPQYEAIIEDTSEKFTSLVLTNDLFPGHTCCVLAGVTSYMSSHSDETVRFLEAYVKAVEYVNYALENKDSEQYARLVAVALETVGSTFTESEIKASLDTITYTYGDSDPNNPLASLNSDLVDLVDSLDSLGTLQKSVTSDLGFDSTQSFVDEFVDDSYLVSALESNDTNTYSGTTSSITVAVITGDLHQIAIHMAEELGYFDAYGLDVHFSYATNGAGVATALQNGDAQFGLLGAPPLTITTVNSELIKA